MEGRAMSDLRQPRRTLFGVKRADYEQLLARDAARAARFDEALAEAVVVAREVDEAVIRLVWLVSADVLDEEVAAGALRELLPHRAAAVELLRAEHLPAELREALQDVDGGTATLVHAAASGGGEQPLDATVALAGNRAVVVRYVDAVYDDGGLSLLVERLAHALAASLEAREVAGNGRRRRPVTLLGGEREAEQFEALREAQGQPTERITISVAGETREAFVGLFGEPAWHGQLFHLAQSLDTAARMLGGEAFELPGTFACVVNRGEGDAMRGAARTLLAAASLDVELLER
jgi:hypothetical protein